MAYGGVAGFLIGVSIGWSRRIGYWVHPVLRVRIVPTPHRRIRQHHNRCRRLTHGSRRCC
uniref:Uncharacterized protein n=1 Tax=Cupriavidus pinatubonensis (strain JMP 134 / LMG 1197) TaxID=264198 RepID=Q46R38_CUPPJ